MDSLFFFKYTVTFYEELEDKEKIEEGLSIGKTIKDVSGRIADYYGDENIIKIYIESTDYEEVFPLENNILFQQNLIN